jgi:hypothetical protein
LRRYYTRDVIDTLQLWTEWSGNKRGVTLDAWARLWDAGRKQARATKSLSGGVSEICKASGRIAARMSDSHIRFSVGSFIGSRRHFLPTPSQPQLSWRARSWRTSLRRTYATHRQTRS